MFTFDQSAIYVAKEYRNEQIRAAERARRVRAAKSHPERHRPRRVVAGAVATGVVFAVGAAIAVTGATDASFQDDARRSHHSY